MKWIRVPKFVIIIGSFFIILLGFVCGYKSAESILNDDLEKKSCKQKVEYIETCSEGKEEEFAFGYNKYIVVTNSRILTLQNDGGSYTNIYYEIDLSAKVVTQKADKYVGFKGFDYEGRERKKRYLSEDESLEVKAILEGIIANPEEIEEGDYLYYTLKNKDNDDMRFSSKEKIQRLEELFE